MVKLDIRAIPGDVNEFSFSFMDAFRSDFIAIHYGGQSSKCRKPVWRKTA
jgi:hypothetical protein